MCTHEVFVGYVVWCYRQELRKRLGLSYSTGSV